MIGTHSLFDQNRPPAVPAPGFPLALSQEHIRKALLGPGWAGADPTGLWSEGPAALLTLPAPLWRKGGTLVLSFATLPRLCGAPPLILRAEVLLGLEARVLSRIERHGGAHDWPLPLRGFWEKEQALTIALHFDNLKSPRDLGINADPRALGMFLVRIDHEEAQYA